MLCRKQFIKHCIPGEKCWKFFLLSCLKSILHSIYIIYEPNYFNLPLPPLITTQFIHPCLSDTKYLNLLMLCYLI